MSLSLATQLAGLLTGISEGIQALAGEFSTVRSFVTSKIL